MNMNIFSLIILSLFFSVNNMAMAETITETYEKGLVLHFIPMGETEPLGIMIDKNTAFDGYSFKNNKALVKYEKMPHWLLWQGFYKAEKSGKYFFAFKGKSNYQCKFEANLAGNKLIKLSGRLDGLFGYKILNLEEGVHKFEVSLSCPDYSRANVSVEIKRPNENDVGKINGNEFLHKKK